MNTLFIISLIVIFIIYLNRRKISVLMTKDRTGRSGNQTGQKEPENESCKSTFYKILAYNAKDFETTKDLEDAMDLRLERCISGLAKQGHHAEVEVYSGGFVIVYLVKYSC
ncbi:MAG: hypothetical protein NC313_16625 [Butyrivibrio sp.]|nr:hypothetical protein [Butyrivibrio sp.]